MIKVESVDLVTLYFMQHITNFILKYTFLKVFSVKNPHSESLVRVASLSTIAEILICRVTFGLK